MISTRIDLKKAIVLLIVFCAVSTGYAKENAVAPDSVAITAETAKVPVGDAALIKVELGRSAESVTGSCYGKDIFFFKMDESARTYYAFVGTDINQTDDSETMKINIDYKDGTLKSVDYSILLRGVDYPEEEITVDKKMVEPPKETLDRIFKERESVMEVYSNSKKEQLFGAEFMMPLNTKYSSSYGKRRIINGIRKSPHSGLDMRGEVGRIIKASNSGRIVLARNLYFTGNTLIIDNGIGIFTAYFHLSRMYKGENESVKKGEAIGEVGMTGRVTGPNLHFGVKVNGFYVNPVSMITLSKKAFQQKSLKAMNVLTK